MNEADRASAKGTHTRDDQGVPWMNTRGGPSGFPWMVYLILNSRVLVQKHADPVKSNWFILDGSDGVQVDTGARFY